ncbi:LysR family transcriptional regulator [Amycolatopsis sp., V23-08]|uniref:LysR family transcriptional regulator n=1 Tax=Amycolatopsis heterodermiae TaxID=3110235 RepID=A0ABU5RBR1_9PSEU|nr:LysR family transcriptional regulator [Amycolatopsis sp., V23-08]MEA5363084.1 LysR family transcriptional regulator [Amycolatopsis sp., V23-08]
MLQRFERQIGTKLFVRSHTGVTPTPAGEQTLRRALVLLLDFDRFEADLLGVAGTGPLRLGSSQMDCLPTFVERLDDALPGLEVTVHLEPSSAVLARSLARATLDIAVIAMSDDQEVPLAKHLGHRVLLPWVPVFVGLPARHPLAGRDDVDLADLADEAWIGPPGPEDGSLTSLRAAAHRAGFTPRIRFECPNGGGRPLIAAGDCAGQLEPTAPELPGMVVRPLKNDPMRLRLVLAWRKERVTWDQAEQVYRAAMTSYTRHAMASVPFRSWWTRRRDERSWDSLVGYFGETG